METGQQLWDPHLWNDRAPPLAAWQNTGAQRIVIDNTGPIIRILSLAWEDLDKSWNSSHHLEQEKPWKTSLI